MWAYFTNYLIDIVDLGNQKLWGAWLNKTKSGLTKEAEKAKPNTARKVGRAQFEKEFLVLEPFPVKKKNQDIIFVRHPI